MNPTSQSSQNFSQYSQSYQYPSAPLYPSTPQGEPILPNHSGTPAGTPAPSSSSLGSVQYPVPFPEFDFNEPIPNFNNSQLTGSGNAQPGSESLFTNLSGNLRPRSALGDNESGDLHRARRQRTASSSSYNGFDLSSELGHTQDEVVNDPAALVDTEALIRKYKLTNTDGTNLTSFITVRNV